MVSEKKPVPKSVVKAIKVKRNRVFLRRLYNLPYGASKTERIRVLNLGTKKQRHLLIHILHQIMLKEITLPIEHEKVILLSGKTEFLGNNFFNPKDVSELLKSSDVHQRDVLAKVNNYHILLYRLFNLKK